MIKQGEVLLTVREVAKHLGMGQGSIYRLANTGDIPVIKLSKTSMWRFKLSAVEEWIKSKEINNLSTKTNHNNNTNLTITDNNRTVTDDDKLTVSEVASILDKCQETVRELCRSGKLQSHKLFNNKTTHDRVPWFIFRKDAESYRENDRFLGTRGRPKGSTNNFKMNNVQNGNVPLNTLDTLEESIDQITNILNKASASDREFIKEWIQSI